jgi:coenzyme F420-0:L-glutamate ligase/coenzyme F420-1:gamma-L-glutamate ligase
MVSKITLLAIPQMPHIQPGDDVAQLLMSALAAAEIRPRDGDVLVVAQKIVSKAEGRSVRLADVVPGERAIEVAAQTGKDARLVELILRESQEISRTKRNLLIVRHRLGFTSANAGIDRSNVAQSPGGDTVLLLPTDPDTSAEQVRRLFRDDLGVDVGVIISDSHGRPFRLGTVGVAIGVAGLPALWDRRGDRDLYGYTLQHTEVGLADEIAAAAGLLMGQAGEGIPAVLVRGITMPPGEGKARDLVRPQEQDLYR